MESKTNTNDTRNIIDYYKYWTTEAVLADLDAKRNNFSVLISNKFHDFNIGSVIRNANAFLAKEVIVYGSKKFDHRGTVGTHHYTHFKHVRLTEKLEFPDSVVIGIDNIPNSKPIENFNWPRDKHVVLAFGQEDIGLPPEILAVCNDFAYIKQYGSVRSLNVGCASAIAMFSYCQGL